MLLSPIITTFCMQFQSSGNSGCQAIFNQISNETKTTQALDQLQSYSQSYAYKNIDPTLIKTTIAIGYLYNAFNEQMIRMQVPIKSFEFDANLGIISKGGGLKYKYEF